MILKGYIAKNGKNVENIDSKDELLREFAEENQDQLMLFVGDKPERDEDGFEEWIHNPDYSITLPKHEWNKLTWEDEPVEVEIHIKDK